MPFDFGNSIVHLKESSFLVYGARLANMTLKLIPDEVNLSTIKENKTVSLLIGNYSNILPGSYYLTISANNGIVTKSIFVELDIPHIKK